MTLASAAGLTAVGAKTVQLGTDVSDATRQWWTKTSEWFAAEMEEVQPQAAGTTLA